MKRWVSALFIFLILIFTVGAFYFTYVWMPRHGKAFIERVTSAKIHGEVSIGTLEVRLPSTVVFHDVNIYTPTFSFSGSRIVVALSPVQGILGQAVIRSLVVEKFHIDANIYTEAEKKEPLFVQRLLRTFQTSFVYFRIENMVLKNGEFNLTFTGASGHQWVKSRIEKAVLSLTSRPLRVSVKALALKTLRLGGTVPESQWRALSIQQGEFNIDDREIAVETVSLLDNQNCRINIHNFYASDWDRIHINHLQVSAETGEGCGGIAITEKLKGSLLCNLENLKTSRSSKNLDFAYECNVKGLELGHFRFGNIRATGNVRNFSVSITSFTAHLMGGTVNGTGFLDLQKHHMKIVTSLNGITIEGIGTSMGLEHSRVTARLFSRSLTWSTRDFEEFHVEGAVNVKDFFTFTHDYRNPLKAVVVETPRAHLLVSGAFMAHAFRLDRALVYFNGHKAMEVKGEFGFEDHMFLSVKGDRFPLDVLGHVGPVKISGTTDLECTIQSDYHDVNISGQFKSWKGRIFGFDYTFLSSRVEYSQKLLKFSPISGTTGGGLVKGSVEIDFGPEEGAVYGHLQADKVVPALLSNEYADIGYLMGFVVDRRAKTANLRMKVTGPFNDVRVYFETTAKELYLKHTSYRPDVTIHGLYAQESFSLDVKDKAERILYHLKVSGSEEKNDLKIEMRAGLKNFPVIRELFTASLTGSIHAVFREEEGWRLSGNMNASVKKTSLILPGLSESFYINTENGITNLETSSQKIKVQYFWNTGILKASVTSSRALTIFRDGPFDVSMQGGAEILSEHSYRYEVSFPSGATFTVAGVSYTISPATGLGYNSKRRALYVLSQTRSVKNLITSEDNSEFIKILSGNKLKIQTAAHGFGVLDYLRLTRGIQINATASGTLQLSPFKFRGVLKPYRAEWGPFAVSLPDEPWKFTWNWENLLNVSSSGGASIILQPSKKQLSLNIPALEVEYEGPPQIRLRCTAGGDLKEIDLLCRVLTKRVYYDMTWHKMVSGDGEEKEWKPLPVSINANITIDSLQLYSETQNMSLSGSLRINAGKEFSLNGRLRFTGRYKFRNVWFRVRNGTFLLSSARPGVPYVEASAETEIVALKGIEKRYRITVDVEGWVDGLKMKFSSSPPLKDSEILSLITFGVPEAGDVTGGQQISNIEKATLGMELLFGSEMKDVARRFGISDLAISSGYEEITRRLASRLSISSNVSPRLTIEYQRDIIEKDQSVFLLYRLTNSVILQGGWDNKAFDVVEDVNSPVGNFSLKINARWNFDW